MNDNKVSPDPVETLHGFHITPTYLSKNGTCQICKTVQGYRVTCVDRTKRVWGDAEGKGLWTSGLKEARQCVNKWHNDAHGTGRTVKELAELRTDYVDYLALHFGETEHIALARSEARHQALLAKQEAQRKELLPFFKRIADPADGKAPIDSFCHEDERFKTAQAVEFFTGNPATFTAIAGKPGWFRVTSVGHRQYNEPGHVCPDTHRRAVPAADYVKLEDEPPAFYYNSEAASYGMECWYLIDGVDMSTDGKTCSLWLDNGRQITDLPAQHVVYVQQRKSRA